MGIMLERGMVIATVVEQRNLPAGMVGNKAVFDLHECMESDLPCSWFMEPLQNLAVESLVTGQFQVCRLNNPEQMEQEVRIMLDPYLAPHELIILGGGHIAKSLVELGNLLGYITTVVDDREEFVSEQRFPQASRRICCSFDDLDKNLSPGSRSSVVVVTRGHQHDWICLRQMLKYPLVYLGVIGSRRKVAMLRENILSAGYPEEICNRIYMPIGLNIGAQTPEEIAVSIAAELINVRRSGKAYSLKGGKPEPVNGHGEEVSSTMELDVIKKAVEVADKGIPAALATIVVSTGSTPRKAGSRMLLLQDGTMYGTIGGGIGEAQVAKEAQNVMRIGLPVICNVSMTAEDAAMEGMVCGGSLEVFIEPVNRLEGIFCGRG
ncbi:MAG: XdhC/CoxI family protein [Syntrophomonas sp.]